MYKGVYTGLANMEYQKKTIWSKCSTARAQHEYLDFRSSEKRGGWAGGGGKKIRTRKGTRNKGLSASWALLKITGTTDESVRVMTPGHIGVPRW